MRTANIFDDIKKTLDQRVFRGMNPRHRVVEFILEDFKKAISKELKINAEEYFDFYLTGSLTTYQYSDDSDCDIGVFPDYDALSEAGYEPKQLRRQLISLMIDKLDGTFIPGTQHPLQHFIQPVGLRPKDLFKRGERSAWDFQTRKWFVEPEKLRSHEISKEFPALFQRANECADKMQQLLENGDVDGAISYYKMIHKMRMRDQKAGLGDFSEANIIYKYLLHSGLFEALNNTGQIHIAKAVCVGDHPDKRWIQRAAEWYSSVLGLDGMEIVVDLWPDYSIPGWSAPAVFALTDPITVGMDLQNAKPLPYSRIILAIGPGTPYEWDAGTRRHWITLLAHEFIHAAQFHRCYGDMSPEQAKAEDNFEKVIQANNFREQDYLKNYTRVPWEEEAYDWMDAYGDEAHRVLNVPEAEKYEYTPKYNEDDDPTAWENDDLDDEAYQYWQAWDEKKRKQQPQQPRQRKQDNPDEWPHIKNIFETSVRWSNAWKQSDERQKVIYDFDADRIWIGTTSEALSNSGSTIVGDYDNGRVHLNESAGQWLNANYFKKLWLYSFPKKPFTELFVEHNDQHLHVPTKPVNMGPGGFPNDQAEPALVYDKPQAQEPGELQALQPGAWSGTRQEAEAHSRVSKEQVKDAASLRFPTPQEVDEIIQGFMESTGEPWQGWREGGLELVEGVLGSVQNMVYYGQYGDLFDVAGDLIFRIQDRQGAVEGNKRTATAVGVAFLEENGWPDAAPLLEMPQEGAPGVLGVQLLDAVEGRQSPEDFTKWIRKTLASTPELKKLAYRFAFCDGKLRYVPNHPRTLDFITLAHLVDYEPGKDFACGLYDLNTGHVDVLHGDFEERELRYILERESGPVTSADFSQRSTPAGVGPHRAKSDDTEPQGGDGFLADPHEELYPALFKGGDTIPDDVVAVLKSHVLNKIEMEFHHGEQWIYFTIFGSGVSYNWNEEGDLDIQMWVDVDVFNEIHTDEPKDADQLVLEVRRLINLVNFPTLRSLGLDGDMIVQYYANAGHGTVEENLAKKPYACYDLETSEWIERPKPLKPQYYGDWFLKLEPKAKDIATQAEAAMDALMRDTIDAQFWAKLYDKNHNPRYEDAYKDARRRAEMDLDGVKNLFKAIFKGRQQAYSPTGEGIKDERDMIQKLLEVWGIFQRLKTLSRQPLPWKEQELPEAPEDGKDKDDGDDKPNHTVVIRGSSVVAAHHKYATWTDLMNKAQRLRNDGQVHVLRNSYDHLVGRVQGDHGVYTCQVWRQDPHSRTITMWDCECPWDDYAWDRTRQWKKYEGRPCSHVLALFWEAQGKPLEGQDIQPGPSADQQVPESTPYGQLPPGGNVPSYVPGQEPNLPIGPFPPGGLTSPGTLPAGPPVPGAANPPLSVPPAVAEGIVGQLPSGAAPAAEGQGGGSAGYPGSTSMPTKPGEGGTVAIPGAFSKWIRKAAFENGQRVRANRPMSGTDRDGEIWNIPRNAHGEVLSGDEDSTVVIFPLSTGQLQPHLVRVVAPPEAFSLLSGGTPFIKRKR